MMAAAWTKYLRVLEKHPWRTMSGTTGALMVAGDAISQLAVEKRGITKFDTVRNSRFLVFGLFVIGPALRGWYMTLDRFLKGTTAAPLKMMLLDQSLFAPTILMTFLVGMGALKQDSWEEIKSKVKKDYGTILLTNYKVWPASQLINFYFMPLQHRVLFVNFVSLGWNTYLAWASEK